MENEKLIRNTLKLFSGNLKVINVGSTHFADTLRMQGVVVEQVDWKHRSGGGTELENILDAMGLDD